MQEEIHARFEAPPSLSAFAAYGCGGGYALMFALALFAALRWRRRARAADASADPQAPLTVGDTVIVGVVESEPDAGPAVRVEVEQEGTEEESSGTWSHRWTERERRMSVRPFFVRHASGQRVLVEPTRDAFLVDDLDGVIQIDLLRRVRVAELVPGESVIATGVLARAPMPGIGASAGYRDVPQGWVLRPPRGERMLLSTAPLGRGFRGRARAHAAAAFVILFAATAMHLLLLGFHLRFALGEPCEGTVLERLSYVTRNDDNKEFQHHDLIVALPNGRALREEIDANDWHRVGEGAGIPVVFVRAAPWASGLGVHPTVALWRTLVVGGVFVAVLLLWGAVLLPKPWYETKVVEVGTGRIQPG